ncbi:hypothetical protein JOQ06_002225 [Pogonophryne albipinna]|uniref:Uncharacterized protein n=1 Tax=Pogonophryne albipinna TaxID=1090488 RepID=A0AAD6FKL2_9TELE|nr:hypothetical protein JOQ06_002225 [Pogonophryne albipinna]
MSSLHCRGEEAAVGKYSRNLNKGKRLQKHCEKDLITMLSDNDNTCRRAKHVGSFSQGLSITKILNNMRFSNTPENLNVSLLRVKIPLLTGDHVEEQHLC